MQDRIYYVEGPEGDILGPMPMIQVLEGVAAGLILEDARLCEVGASEWVELADVAHARSTNGMPSYSEERKQEPTLETARQNAPEPTPIETTFVDTDLDEAGLHEIQSAALYEMDLEAEIRNEGLLDQAEALLRDERDGAARGNGERVVGDDFDIVMHEEDPLSQTSPSRYDEEAPVVIQHEAYLSPLSQLTPLPEEEVPVEMIRETEGGWMAAHPETAQDEFALSDLSDQSPANDAEFASMVDALEEHSESSPEGSGDFAMEIQEESFATVEEVATGPSSHPRPRWLVPALLGAGVCLVAGILAFQNSRKASEKQAAAKTNGSKPAAAVVSAPMASESDRSKARALFDEATAKIKSKDRKGAITLLMDAVKLDANSKEARRELAMQLAESGRKTPAIEEMTGYLNLAPEDEKAQRQRLDWMLATGQTGEAGLLYGELARSNPENENFQLMAGLAGGDTETSAAALRKAISLNPKNREAHFALGKVLAGLGRPVDAVQSLETAFALGKPNAKEKKYFGELQAEAKVASASATSPPPTTLARSQEFLVAIRQIESAMELENYDDAQKSIESIRSKLGSDAEVARTLTLLQGVMEFERGRYDQALSKFESIDATASYSALGAGRGAVSNWVARTRLARGDHRGAIQAFDQVKEGGDPDEKAIAALWEGVALQTLGMGDLAERTWKQMPQEVGAEVGAAGKSAVKTAQYLTGAVSEKEYLQSVDGVAGFENDMHYFLGRVALNRSDREDAAEHFRKSLEASRGREFPYCLAESQASGGKSAKGSAPPKGKTGR